MSCKIQKLVSVLRKAPGRIFIQPHDVPDPDAAASAHALRWLLAEFGIETKVIYAREYEKIDVKRMVELLDIELLSLSKAVVRGEEDWIVIVDGQKGNANIGDAHCTVAAVIDHHVPRHGETYLYEDIRPEAGSCAAIIAEYYTEAAIEPPAPVATALVYGIFVDTNNLTRAVSALDARMFCWLHAFYDPERIRTLRGSQITLKDLAVYAEGFKTLEVYDRLAFLMLVDADDSVIGAANDIVSSLDEVDVSIAFSSRCDGLKISVRSVTEKIHADDVIRAIVRTIGFGGGHEHMAGGFIPAEKLPLGKPPALFIQHRAITYIESLPAL